MAYSDLSFPFQYMKISMGNEFLRLPKFVTDILDDTYTCVYCKNTLRSPVLQLLCGHRVCGLECIGKMKSEGLQHCPSMEDEECSKVDINDESNIYPDMEITRQLMKSIVLCHNYVNGCPEKLAWKDLESHLQVCTYVSVECENVFRGCEVKLLKDQMKDHQKKECLYVYIVCSQCSQNVLKLEMENHLKECLLKQKQPSMLLNGVQIYNQGVRIGQLESRGGVGIQNDIKIQCMETTSYDGTLIWKIGQYMKRKEEAKSTQVVSIFSPPLYTTNRYGYKWCLRLYLNGDGMGKGSHISVYISIMQGEYDTQLEWPFRNKVIITIMDQDSHRKHFTDSFRPDPTSKSFLRPVSEYNIAFGFPLFMAQSIVESPTYLKDDTIFIKATIDRISP